MTGKFNKWLFCECIEDKLNSLAEKYEELFDTIFKPFQLLLNRLVKLKKVEAKGFFNKKEESPIRNKGFNENLFETLVLSQCEPSKICSKILEELEICFAK